MKLLPSGVLLLATSALAALTPGEFRLEGGRVLADVKSWGQDCGPQPRAEKLPGGDLYDFTATGALAPKGRAQPLFGPGVCMVASGLKGLTQSGGGRRITCRSAPGAPKQVSGTVQLSAGTEDPNKVGVTHRFSYDWRLKGSHCQVTVATIFTLRRTASIEVAAPEPPPPPPPPPARCGQVGPVVRVSARGSARRAVKVDGRLRLSVQAFDADGCPAEAGVEWTASEGRIRGGVFDARGVAPGQTVSVEATISGQPPVVFTVEVLQAADLAALRADQPELLEGALAPSRAQHGAGVGASAEQEEDDDGLGRLLLALFVGFVVVAVGIGGLIAVRAMRRGGTLLDEEQLARIDALTSQPTGAEPPAHPRPPSDTSRQCPLCHKLYDAGTRFCPFDASPLDVQESEAADPLLTSSGLQLGVVARQERICPHCGARYPADVQFCGLDGTRLVLLN